MNMKYSEATKKLEDAGFCTEQNYNDYDISKRSSDELVATVKSDDRGVLDTDYFEFRNLTEDDKDLILDIGMALAKTYPVNRKGYVYRIKLNDTLYFAGHEDTKVIAVAADVPGALGFAKVYKDYQDARALAALLGGTTEEFEV